MDQEQIVLTLDGSQVASAINKLNAGITGHEAKFTGIVDSMGRRWNLYGDQVVRVSDRSKGSIDRLVASMQKQAEIFAKSGVDKLIAQRDLLIQRYSGEQRAVDAVTQSYDKMIAAQKKLDAASHTGGAANNKLFLGAKDLFEGRTAYAEVEVGKFLASLTGTAAVVGGVTAALGGLAIAGYESAKSLGNFAIQTENIHLKTGLAVSEVEQFTFAAKAAGSTVEVFDRMMRGLSQAADENSKQGEKARDAMERLHITLRDETGALKPTSEMLLEISDALNKLPAGAERDAAAMDLFKRAGVEAIPVITQLRDRIAEAHKLGLGVSEADIDTWKKYHDRMEEASATWDRLFRKVKGFSAGAFMAVVHALTSASDSNDPLSNAVRDLTRTPDYRLTGGAPPAPESGISTESPGDKYSIARAQAILKRQATDRDISSFYARESRDPAYRLRQDEEALSRMEKPIAGATTAEELTKYQNAQHRVDADKAAIEAARKAKENETRLESYEKSMTEKAVDPFTKLVMDRDALVKENPSGAARATRAASIASDQLWEQVTRTQNAKRNEFPLGISANTPDRVIDMTAVARKNTEDIDKENYKKEAAALQNLILAHFKEINDSNDTGEYNLNKLALQGKQTERLIGLTGRPGDELSTLAQQLAVRKQIRDQEMEIKSLHVSMYDMDKERQKDELDNLKDRYEFEEKILEMRRHQFEEVQKTSEHLVTTLFTSPSKFGSVLGSTLKEAAIKPVAENVSRQIATFVTPMIYGPNGQGGIAGLLGGRSNDPVKMSTDLNTTVTMQNTVAVNGLTAALAGGTVAQGGGFAGSLGGGGSTTTILNGGGGTLASMGGMLGDLGSGGPMMSGTTYSPSASGGLGGIFGSTAGLKGALGNFKGSLTGLRNFVGLGKGPQDLGGGVGINDVLKNGTLGQKLTAIGRSPAMGAAGSLLAMNGLVGNHAGSWGGIAEGAGGGAMIGFQMGGPLGAAIGAGVGAAVGLGEKLAGVESPTNEAKRLVKSIYSISIDTNTAKQIVSIAQQKYAGHVSVAVRDPDVRKMLMLYSQATGQKMPLSAGTPRAGSLSEQGGKLYQDPGYVNGQAYTFQSNLPVAGGYATGTYPTPSSISLNINGQSAADLLEGRIANTVTPGFVQDQWATASAYSNGRLQNSASIQQPGLTVS